MKDWVKAEVARRRTVWKHADEYQTGVQGFMDRERNRSHPRGAKELGDVEE